MLVLHKPGREDVVPEEGHLLLKLGLAVDHPVQPASEVVAILVELTEGESSAMPDLLKKWSEFTDDNGDKRSLNSMKDPKFPDDATKFNPILSGKRLNIIIGKARKDLETFRKQFDNKEAK